MAKEKTNYQRLVEMQKNYPELTFDNDGYQYLPGTIRERHKEQIEKIESILKETVEGFKKFNNFKPRKDGSFDIRCQHSWTSNFGGVGYFSIKEFKTELDMQETTYSFTVTLIGSGESIEEAWADAQEHFNIDEEPLPEVFQVEDEEG